MSLGMILYLGGMLALYVGQRILDGFDLPQSFVTVVGGLALAAAAFLRFRRLRAAKDAGQRVGHRYALMLLLVGVASVVMYVGTTDAFVQGLALDDAGEERWLGLSRSAWPVVWLLGTLPLLVVDYSLHSSPTMVPVRRVREGLVHGLVAAMGLAMLFPLDYVATKRNEKWDLAYFKTPTPGTATVALVEALEEPVTVRIFMPPSSEVATELRDYFAPLEGPKLSVEILDQAANPRLAKALAVRDNGTVAITQGDISVLMDPVQPAEGEEAAQDDRPQPVTRRLTINPDLDKAKRTLKRIDAEVAKLLIELGGSERIAYFTTGHGEHNWSQDKTVADGSVRELRARMLELGFKVKPLGIPEGLGQEVPADASLVVIVAPRAPFFQAEVDAIEAHLDRGGALLLAREPVLMRPGEQKPDDPLDGLMEKLGVTMGEGVLAAERGILPLSRNRRDVFNIATDSFSAHPTTTQVNDPSRQLAVVAPAAGYLEEVEGHPNSLVFVMRSLAFTWADDGDTKFDSDKGETKAARNLMAAVEGSGKASWRAVVTSDASMFADLGMGLSEGLSLGNKELITDTINWLIGAEALSGTTESEEDIKIEHTKEDQQWWFYLTVLLVPLGVVLLGAMRIRLRHKGGAA